MAVLSKALAIFALPFLANASRLVASHFSGTVYALNLSDDNKLSISSQQSGLQRIPAWVNWDSATRTAYVSDESWFGANSGKFASYSLSSSGALAVSGIATTNGGDLAGGLYGGSNGNSFIGQANYNAGTLTTYKLPLTSSSKPQQTFKYTLSQPGPRPDRQDASHLHSVFVDPTGKYLLSGDLGADRIRIWSIDASSGQLTECTPITSGAGSGPRHGSFSVVDGSTYLYIVNELGNSVSGYTISYPSGGCLTGSQFQTISTFPSNQTVPTTYKAAGIHVKGNFLYASNRNDQTFGTQKDSIATYSIDPASGELTFLELANSNGFFPRTFDINKAGDKVAVGGQTDAVVTILKRDTTSGLLGPVLGSLQVGQRGTNGGEDGLSAVVWAE